MFIPVKDDITEADLKEEFKELDDAYNANVIPDTPNPIPFDDFLFRIRMKEILDNHISLKVR